MRGPLPHSSRAALKEKIPFLNYGELNEFYASASLLRRGTPRGDGEFSSEAAAKICGRTGKSSYHRHYTYYQYIYIYIHRRRCRRRYDPKNSESFDYRRCIT